MIKFPGAYLITQCNTDSCPFNSANIYIFLGIGKFDIGHLRQHCICGGCKKSIQVISEIAFVNCIWWYKGVTEGRPPEESLKYKATHDFSYFPGKDIPWKTLAIQTAETTRNLSSVNLCEVGVQTAEEEENDVNHEIIKALTKEAERYRAKYKTLKDEVNFIE